MILYEQTWVLERHSENIPTDMVKSISVEKKWLMNSFFDIGSIHFLVEWNDEKWDIIMHHVDAVEHMESRIKNIIYKKIPTPKDS